MVSGVACQHASRRVSTSEDQIVDERGSHNCVHVFVVDEDGDPVTGQDVSAHFSSAVGPGAVHHTVRRCEGARGVFT